MTRFELADLLNRSLYMLDNEERHRIIDQTIAQVNEAVSAGTDEEEAVARQGDVQLLVNNILAQHHIDTTVTQSQENNDETVIEGTSVDDTAYFREEKSFRDKFFSRHRVTKKENPSGGPAEKTDENSTYVKPKSIISHLFSFTSDITMGFLNLCLFCILWLPCMSITFMAIVCTVAAVTFYIFTGVGFLGICIAGVGCCIVGTAFTLWLGNLLTGGKRKCEE